MDLQASALPIRDISDDYLPSRVRSSIIHLDKPSTPVLSRDPSIFCFIPPWSM